MKTVAVINASAITHYFPERYNSRIQGLSLLEFIVQRIRKSKNINEIVLSTTKDNADDLLVDIAEKLNIVVYRGHYNDSLNRLYKAATKVKADIVVKVMGHYPLVDPIETDKLIEKFKTGNYKYGYNEHYNGIIMGLGVEIFSSNLIKWANYEMTDPVKRLLGSNIFKDVVDKSDTLIPIYPKARPEYRVTLAVPSDVMILNKLIAECKEINYIGILKYLDENPIIVKYAQQNISVTKEVGVEKIFLFPEKIKTINQSLKSNKLDFSYPLSIELSLTNRCNLTCKWCSDSDLRKKAMVDIDFNVLKIMFHDLAMRGTRGIVIEGGGEPLLHKRFNDIVKCAKDNGLSLGLITNGVEIPDEDILLGCFDWIRVSLDAATKKEFLEWKGLDKFDKVFDNIQRISNNKDKNNFVIGVGYVLTRYNEKQLEDIIINLRKINANYIQIRPVIDHSELTPENNELDYLQKFSTPGFSVNTDSVKENQIKGNFNLPCRAHSLSSVVAASGDVFLCGRLNIYNWIKPIGNLYKKSFGEIWMGKERINQAKMVSNSDFCRKWCPSCRLTKYNILFENTAKIKTKNFI